MERLQSLGATGADERGTAEIWKALVELWRPGTPDGYYRGRRLVIDLNNAEGRAQMLVLANLLAARVAEHVAESTFMALGAAGLLDRDRLLAGSAADRERALEILRDTYRADRQGAQDRSHLRQPSPPGERVRRRFAQRLPRRRR